jgi:hypothetical protein
MSIIERYLPTALKFHCYSLRYIWITISTIVGMPVPSASPIANLSLRLKPPPSEGLVVEVVRWVGVIGNVGVEVLVWVLITVSTVDVDVL